MSVINQVLQELEKRHASGAERGILPDHVRALPDSGGDRRVPWLVLSGVLVAFAGAGAWLALSGIGREPVGLGATIVAPHAQDTGGEKVISTSAAAAIGAAPLPAARMSLKLEGAPAPQPVVETAPPQKRTREPIPSARVVARAEGEPEASVAAKAAATPSPVPASAVAPPTRAEKEQTAPAAVAIPEKPPAQGKPAIEKQVRQASPRELSDNEYRKAAASLHQGRTQEALEGFRSALNLYPEHHGARQTLVALLVESKANGEAERLLQEGIKLAPEQIGFAMTLARLQMDRGDGPGAIATLQGSLAHAQASPDYAAFLAALLQRQGRHEEAIEQFQAALKARPTTGVWWLGFAISLQAVNRGPEAQEAYRRAKTTNNLNAELTAFADQRLRQLQ